MFKRMLIWYCIRFRGADYYRHVTGKTRLWGLD